MPEPRSTAALSRCRNALEPAGAGFGIADTSAPTAAERGALQARRDGLNGALRGARLDDALPCVAALWAMIPMARDDGEQSTADTVRQIAAALCAEPLWAIKAACRRVLDGGARFRPGAPELLKLAREDSAPFRREAAEIERLLAARVVRTPPPEERARVAAGFAALAGELAPLSTVEADTARPRDPGPMTLGEAALATIMRDNRGVWA